MLAAAVSRWAAEEGIQRDPDHALQSLGRNVHRGEGTRWRAGRETSDSRCRLPACFHTALMVSSAFVLLTLRVITYKVISINTSCADLICGKLNDAFRFLQKIWQPSFPSVLSWFKWCSFVNSGPTSFTFWSVLFTSLWKRCLTPSLPNSSHPDPERWTHQNLLIGLFRVFQSGPPEAEWCYCCVQVGAAVTWKRMDSFFFVPVWIIILAVLAGLLLLALLIYLLYKVNRLKISASDGQGSLKPSKSSIW